MATSKVGLLFKNTMWIVPFEDVELCCSAISADVEQEVLSDRNRSASSQSGALGENPPCLLFMNSIHSNNLFFFSFRKCQLSVVGYMTSSIDLAKLIFFCLFVLLCLFLILLWVEFACFNSTVSRNLGALKTFGAQGDWLVSLCLLGWNKIISDWKSVVICSCLWLTSHVCYSKI